MIEDEVVGILKMNIDFHTAQARRLTNALNALLEGGPVEAPSRPASTRGKRGAAETPTPADEPASGAPIRAKRSHHKSGSAAAIAEAAEVAPRRRGRRKMTEAERKAHSKRMKALWRAKRAAGYTTLQA